MIDGNPFPVNVLLQALSLECSARRSEPTRGPRRSLLTALGSSLSPSHKTGAVLFLSCKKDTGVHGFNDFWPDIAVASPQGCGESVPSVARRSPRGRAEAW